MSNADYLIGEVLKEGLAGDVASAVGAASISHGVYKGVKSVLKSNVGRKVAGMAVNAAPPIVRPILKGAIAVAPIAASLWAAHKIGQSAHSKPRFESLGAKSGPVPRGVKIPPGAKSGPLPPWITTTVPKSGPLRPWATTTVPRPTGGPVPLPVGSPTSVRGNTMLGTAAGTATELLVGAGVGSKAGAFAGALAGKVAGEVVAHGVDRVVKGRRKPDPEGYSERD